MGYPSIQACLQIDRLETHILKKTKLIKTPFTQKLLKTLLLVAILFVRNLTKKLLSQE